MYSRLAATVAAGALAITGLAPGTAAAASAPFSDSVQISNNVDSGSHGYWAWDLLRRTVSITKTLEGGSDSPDTYRVVLRDSGAFNAIKGAKSPGAGVTIANAVSGSFSGSYTFSVVSATPPSAAGVANSYNYACTVAGSCPGRPASTSDWPKLYFDGQAVVTPNTDWAWHYRTCAEQWNNTAAGNSGDITGALCAARVTATSPTAVQPACDTERGTLVVPAKRGVTYKVRGRTWTPGEHKVRPGTYRVTAKARDGFTLRGDRRWTLTVDAAKACATPTPTPTPTVTVTDAPAEVTPKAPSLTQPSCADKTASVAIPEVEGVVYKTGSGSTLEGGKSYSVDAGSVTIVAEAADGHVLDADATATWTLVVSDSPDCATATPATTTRVVVVGDVRVPVRVDTGLGGLA